MRSIVNGVPEYSGQNLDYIGFPLGGLGAGNICIQGTGALSGFSIRNQPDYYFEPNVLSAICVKEPGGNIARVLEGPVPKPKIFGGALQSPAAQGKGAVTFVELSMTPQLNPEGSFPFQPAVIIKTSRATMACLTKFLTGCWIESCRRRPMLEDAGGIRRVVLACGFVDLHKGIDGLAQIIGSQYDLKPFSVADVQTV